MGDWSDVTRGAILNSGTLTVKIDSSGGVTKLTKLAATGGFGADPPCTSGQCWAFATVFRGTITESPTETVIEGDWAGVPQSRSQGSSVGHMKFFVFNHKIIIPATPGIFPVTIEKMYDGPETGIESTQGTKVQDNHLQ